jgi:hypothetical protein
MIRGNHNGINQQRNNQMHAVSRQHSYKLYNLTLNEKARKGKIPEAMKVNGKPRARSLATAKGGEIMESGERHTEK